jgi:hypothetical protein
LAVNFSTFCQKSNTVLSFKTDLLLISNAIFLYILIIFYGAKITQHFIQLQKKSKNITSYFVDCLTAKNAKNNLQKAERN